MRLVFLSDTHGFHDGIAVPDGDVLVHAGDFGNVGRPREIESFAAWFGAQPHRHLIAIPGNHDRLCERDPARAEQLIRLHGPRITWLVDAGVTLDGVSFWGSPWTPTFFDWAFMEPSPALAARWARIPTGVDVLVTHGPPAAIHDRCVGGNQAGCPTLREAVFGRVRPRVHAFGHIHEAYGSSTEDGIRFVNASICDVRYAPANPPIVVDL